MAKVDKYLIALEECKNLTSQSIISKYELSKYEIEIMKYLYKKQELKTDLIDVFYWKWQIPKQTTSKIFGILKKKGLIYSVVGITGYLGTDIKV